MSEQPNFGFKLDTGKFRWSLMPFDAIRAIGQVFQWACSPAKPVPYPERNWEQGMEWGRVYDALLRHTTAWWERDPHDPESKMSHLWHAGCCLLMLIAMEIRGLGLDNRPPKPRKRRMEQKPPVPRSRKAECPIGRPTTGEPVE